MHERAVAQDLLDAALRAAKENHASRVTVLHIRLSCAAGESCDALRFHLEQLVRGTIAEGAALDIVEVPADLKCLECGYEGTAEDLLACPKCSSLRVYPLEMEAFRLESIDVEPDGGQA